LRPPEPLEAQTLLHFAAATSTRQTGDGGSGTGGGLAGGNGGGGGGGWRTRREKLAASWMSRARCGLESKLTQKLQAWQRQKRQ